MFKKIEIWILYIIIIFFIIFLILFGGILRHSYLGGERFLLIQKISTFIASIPYNVKNIYNLTKDPGIDFVDKTNKFSKKPKFKRFLDDNNNGILLLSRYDGNLSRAIVEVVDLKDFSILHTYHPNPDEILNSINYKDKEEFKGIEKHITKNRLFLWHPYLEKNGNIIFNSSSPLINIDFCSNLVWVNDANIYHHSIEKDHEGNYWVPSILVPNLIKDKNYKKMKGDDGITKLSPEGEVIFEKSVVQILIDNNYKNLLFSQFKFNNDIIHLNDIEPVLMDGPYWQKGDLFLSIRSLSMIILYRPSTNKILHMIRSNISFQHDVDIINKKTISIFNNNLFNTPDGQKIFSYSEIIFYDFEHDEFTNKYQKTLERNDMKTPFGGLIQHLDNGSFMIEEQEYGRILFFNKDEQLVWEFVNKAENNKVYVLRWSRIIQDEEIIKNFKNLLNNKKCQN